MKMNRKEKLAKMILFDQDGRKLNTLRDVDEKKAFEGIRGVFKKINGK